MIFSTGDRAKRVLASTASLALAAGGLFVMAAAPAQAASGTLNYTCQTSLGEKTFTAVVSTNLPATMIEGSSFTPTVSATVDVPQSVTDPLYFFGWNNAQGTSVATSLINGTPVDVNLTFPLTGFNNSNKPLVIQASGIADNPIVAGAAGTSIVVEASNFTTAVKFGKDNDPNAVENQAPSCVLASGQNAVVNTVQVVSATPDPEPEPEPGPVQVTVGSDIVAGANLPVTFSESANGRTFGFELEDGSQLPVGAPIGSNGVAAAAPPAFPLWLGQQTISNGQANVAIPSNVPQGQYTLVVWEILGDGRALVSSSPLNIAAAAVEVPEAPIDNVGDDDEATGDGQLERTDGATNLLPALGVLAMATGGAALGLSRRFGQSI